MTTSVFKKRIRKINAERGAPNAPLSAALRTLPMFKHKCIHCGGWCPCVPETLAVVKDGDEPAGAGGTGVSTVTEDRSDAVQLILLGAGVQNGEDAAEVVADEIPETQWGT